MVPAAAMFLFGVKFTVSLFGVEVALRTSTVALPQVTDAAATTLYPVVRRVSAVSALVLTLNFTSAAAAPLAAS